MRLQKLAKIFAAMLHYTSVKNQRTEYKHSILRHLFFSWVLRILLCPDPISKSPCNLAQLKSIAWHMNSWNGTLQSVQHHCADYVLQLQPLNDVIIQYLWLQVYHRLQAEKFENTTYRQSKQFRIFRKISPHSSTKRWLLSDSGNLVNFCSDSG